MIDVKVRVHHAGSGKHLVASPNPENRSLPFYTLCLTAAVCERQKPVCGCRRRCKTMTGGCSSSLRKGASCHAKGREAQDQDTSRFPGNSQDLKSLIRQRQLPSAQQLLYPLNLNAKSRVERIGGSLPLSARGSLRSLLASLDGRSRRLARALQALAREVGNDLDVERRAVVEVLLVRILEARLLTAIETSSKLDGWVAAGAEALGSGAAGRGRAAGLLNAGGGAALVLLRVALGGAALDLTRVGGVGARVLLHGARALDGGALVLEGVALDREGAGRAGGALNRGRGAAEGAGEGLDVDGTAGGSIGTSGSTSTSRRVGSGRGSRRGGSSVATLKTSVSCHF